MVPDLKITVPSEGTCRDAVCTNPILYNREKVPGVCGNSPRYMQGMVDHALRIGACKSSEFSISIFEGNWVGGEPWLYPTICTFENKECADKVCGLQMVQVNATDGHWECYSDPAVAEYLGEAKYWFENETESSSCRGIKANCEDVGSTRDYDYSTAKSQRHVSRKVVLGVLALAVGTCVSV
jgi:hypothetical protein